MSINWLLLLLLMRARLSAVVFGAATGAAGIAVAGGPVVGAPSAGLGGGIGRCELEGALC